MRGGAAGAIGRALIVAPCNNVAPAAVVRLLLRAAAAEGQGQGGGGDEGTAAWQEVLDSGWLQRESRCSSSSSRWTAYLPGR